ncbi:tRNA 2-methylthio-N6-isopentenyl adenosine(37) hydroxylase MiaE [Nonlabens dokdonensis]|uniref:tRNA 2-methylthio-N6-isopentenyl adenosine(37) hydroxylase MiaE n=1 Tax=Nonlabens dokdonensis TaxID=328515 RepID=A0A1Z8BJQ9_9FLAO|nr:tRNA-(ms[2]io[6]A)-hydroxylase [Nonlabens dokdonensis]OUS22818.1 tRNA 2-methylthio-N6-isopentenyl adenosine(37) hydroxylase MiaE [Nonlabens dokdonensis]
MENTVSKTTLGLNLPTDPRWVDLAAMSMQDILTDHAFCEQKAASTIISIIQMHSDKPEIVEALSPVVTEEWGHFRMVLAELKKRGLTLGIQRPDQYIKELMKGKPKGTGRDQMFLDQLLICALIEARSCERFKILSQKLEEQELKDFYHQFMVAEAAHYKLFLKLAKNFFEEEKVMTRWQYWLDHEAGFLPNLEVRGDRMH